MFFKIGFLKNFINFTEKKKETSTKLLSCEICEIFKNTFFHGTYPVAAFCYVVGVNVMLLKVFNIDT